MSTKFRHVPWQRNIRKIPSQVSNWLDQNPRAKFVVGCAKTIPKSELKSYEHLGIGLAAGRLIYPESRIPICEMGPYSTKNREGSEIKRYDFPMITRTSVSSLPIGAIRPTATIRSSMIVKSISATTSMRRCSPSR